MTNGDSHDHNGGDGGQIAYSSLSGLPTLGTAAATASTDYAPAAKGVTNGDSHDHSGGDGAQIAYSSLSGTPTLGTAAAAATTDFAAASHAHGNITAAGAIGSTANLPLITTTGGAVTVGAFGTGATNFCAGNDARLSDARTPTAHNQAETTITFTDVSTGNASTTAHGFAPKATAPASGLRSVLAIDNGETVRSDKALFDATNPAALGTASPGSAMTAARRDHVHPLPSVREQLTAARTYYVRTDGSDSNTGLANTSGGAFLTIQKAVNVAASLDVGLYNVTISVGTGTFDGVVVLKPYVTVGGLITIEGSATPANHILTNSGGSYNGVCVVASSCGNWRFYGVRISVSASGHKGIEASGLSRITINTVDFTGGLYAHLSAVGPASIYCENGYSISGGVSAGHHIDVRTQGCFSGYGTITLTGTPAFGENFVFADVGGCASFDGISFSGSATGTRYAARAGGIIATFGGETYLPGNTAGWTSSGGIYA